MKLVVSLFDNPAVQQEIPSYPSSPKAILKKSICDNNSIFFTDLQEFSDHNKKICEKMHCCHIYLHMPHECIYITKKNENML